MTRVLGPGAVMNERRGETVSVSKYAGRAVEELHSTICRLWRR